MSMIHTSWLTACCHVLQLNLSAITTTASQVSQLCSRHLVQQKAPAQASLDESYGLKQLRQVGAASYLDDTLAVS